jgi:hypothetical protein
LPIVPTGIEEREHFASTLSRIIRAIPETAKSRTRDRSSPQLSTISPFDLNALREGVDYAYIEPNYSLHINEIPNDPSFNLLWGFNNTDHNDSKASLSHYGAPPPSI